MHRCGCEWQWPPNRTFLHRNALGFSKKWRLYVLIVSPKNHHAQYSRPEK